MSDHLIAEANRHASALSEDLSTIKSSVLAEDVIKALSDIAWYVRECETLRSECEALRAENAALRIIQDQNKMNYQCAIKASMAVEERLKSENAELLRKNSEWESERVQFANRAAKLARLEELVRKGAKRDDVEKWIADDIRACAEHAGKFKEKEKP